jgi:hypothetical protein
MFLAVFDRKWWKVSKRNSNGVYPDMSEIIDKKPEDSSYPASEIEDVTNEEHDTASTDSDDNISMRYPGVSNTESSENEPADDSDDTSADSSDQGDEDIFSNNPGLLVDDTDPLAEAYELSSEEPPEDDETGNEVPINTNISSPGEFFQTELPSRYDILDESEKEQIKGKYRIEIRGSNGGVWTLTLDKELVIRPEKEEAELVLMLNSDDFLTLVNGKINPQLALASRRVKISGNSRKASLFQNILAPRP